jgi:hypothetical protein
MAGLALAAIAGCSAGSGLATPPGSANGAMRAGSVQNVTGVTVALHPDRSPTWMDPAAAKGTLLYVSDFVRGRVFVYSYPGGRAVGSLKGFDRPQGLCADAAGNVWIANTGTSEIIEYAHGGTAPLARLADPKQNPVDCAIDPKSGNLAVANFSNTEGAAGSLAIYRKATGPRKLYRDADLQNAYFLSYDGQGNLFVDGVAPKVGTFTFAELMRGAKTFTPIHLQGVTIQVPGGVRFDGTNLVVGDQTRQVVYQTAGSSIVGSTQLDKACDVAGFAISGSRLVAPNLCSNSSGNVLFYAYPAGGSPTKTIENLAYPIGTAISAAH